MPHRSHGGLWQRCALRSSPVIADAERTRPLVEVSRRRRLLAATAAILLVVAQVPLVLLQARDEPLWFYRPMLTISDLALAPLIVLAAPDVLARARVRTLGAGVTVGAALLAALAVSWLVHPSLQGALILYRLSGALVLATVLADR